MRINRIKAKSILNKHKNGHYTLNQYIGCEFACKYCYSSYLSNMIKEDNSCWGDYVYIKENAVELLKKELGRIKLNYQGPEIMMSSASDPYQWVENKEKLTQNILKTFIEYRFNGLLRITTKSPLILRDLDLIKEIKNKIVSVSIAHNNDKIKNLLEPNVPNITSRFSILEKFNKENVETCVFLAPLLPYYENNMNELEDLLKKIKNVGTNQVVASFLNVYSNMDRYKNLFKNSKKGKEIYIDKADDIKYKKIIKNKILEISNKISLEVVFF